MNNNIKMIDKILKSIAELKTMNFISTIQILDENRLGIHISEEMLNSQGFDKNKLIKKFEDLENYYKKTKEFLTTNELSINRNYFSYINRKLSSDMALFDRLIKNSKSMALPNIDEFLINYYYNILDIDTHREILELFALGTTNRVVFGRNGSGKTKLLNKIRNNYVKSENNIYVIPSGRSIFCGNNKNLTISNLNNLHLETLLSPVDTYYNGYPNDYLTMLFYKKNYTDLENGKSTNINGKNYGVLLKKLIEIYNSLGTTRKLDFDSSNYTFKLYNNEMSIIPYNLSEGSDGERAIFQIISYTLLCPTNSYLLIDEPENHLNSALLKELFNILEEERKDVIFIYFSHDIEFIESRNNVKYVYLDNFNGNNWDVEEIDTFSDIPMDIIIKIIGSKKDILFVEGEFNKLDYKLYSLLFPDKNVIPVSSCENVISHCRSLKDIRFIYQKVEGIIDFDFREQSEIISLNQDNIHVLDYNEIENVLLSSTIIDLVFGKTPALNGKETEFKESIIAKLSQEKQSVFQDFIRKNYSHCIQLPKLMYNEDHSEIEKQIKKITKTNISNLISNLNNFETEFDKILSENNYDEIIKRYPNKGLISTINSFGVKPVFYYDTVFALLKDNPEQCKILKEQILKKET